MRDARIKPKRSTLSARALLHRWIIRGRMTQAEAAEQIGISRVKLNQYLAAAARPSLETASRIEDATGIGMRLWLAEEPPVTAGATGANAGAGAPVAVGESLTEVNHNQETRTQTAS